MRQPIGRHRKRRDGSQRQDWDDIRPAGPNQIEIHCHYPRCVWLERYRAWMTER
jgi:hypothetical protein